MVKVISSQISVSRKNSSFSVLVTCAPGSFVLPVNLTHSQCIICEDGTFQSDANQVNSKQKSETEILVAPQKGLMSPKI